MIKLDFFAKLLDEYAVFIKTFGWIYFFCTFGFILLVGKERVGYFLYFYVVFALIVCHCILLLLLQLAVKKRLSIERFLAIIPWVAIGVFLDALFVTSL